MYATPAAIRRSKLAELIIPSAEDFNFTDWLVGLGHVNGNIVATLPVENTIGGTILDGYAFDVGDISAYSSVVINIYGQVEGRGGDANGGNGSNGLISTMDFTLNVFAGGAIQAGGGGGGIGGAGGGGSAFATDFIDNWIAPGGTEKAYWVQKLTGGADLCADPFDPASFNLYFASTNADGLPGNLPGDSHIGFPCEFTTFAAVTGTTVFRRGTYKGTFLLGFVDQANAEVYSIEQGSYFQTGVSSPGDGGKGQGYEGPAEIGNIGSSTNRAGKGGDGGDGGNWNTDGVSGGMGLSGLFFKFEGDSVHWSTKYSRMSDNNSSTPSSEVGLKGIAGIPLNIPITATINYT